MRIFNRAKNGRDCRGHMLAVSQRLDAMPGVTGRVRSQENRFDAVIFHQLFERWIGLLTPAGFGQSRAPIRKQIAHGHNLHVWMILKSKVRAELAKTDRKSTR